MFFDFWKVFLAIWQNVFASPSVRNFPFIVGSFPPRAKFTRPDTILLVFRYFRRQSLQQVQAFVLHLHQSTRENGRNLLFTYSWMNLRLCQLLSTSGWPWLLHIINPFQAVDWPIIWYRYPCIYTWDVSYGFTWSVSKDSERTGENLKGRSSLEWPVKSSHEN